MHNLKIHGEQNVCLLTMAELKILGDSLTCKLDQGIDENDRYPFVYLQKQIYRLIDSLTYPQV